MDQVEYARARLAVWRAKCVDAENDLRRYQRLRDEAEQLLWRAEQEDGE